MSGWHFDLRCEYNEKGSLWAEFPNGMIAHGMIEDMDGDTVLWEFREGCTVTWKTAIKYGKVIKYHEVSGGITIGKGEVRDMDDAKRLVEYFMSYGSLKGFIQ